MGITKLTLEVGNPSTPDRTVPLEFLIDSGAIYSVVPTEVLEQLGVRPFSEQEFRLADGRRIRRRKGTAHFKYKEHAGGADVVFGEPGDAQLLGAFTLEALGLGLDPIKRELHPIPLML